MRKRELDTKPENLGLVLSHRHGDICIGLASVIFVICLARLLNGVTAADPAACCIWRGMALSRTDAGVIEADSAAGVRPKRAGKGLAEAGVTFPEDTSRAGTIGRFSFARPNGSRRTGDRMASRISALPCESLGAELGTVSTSEPARAKDGVEVVDNDGGEPLSMMVEK